MQPLFQTFGGTTLRFLLLAVLSVTLMVADHRGQYLDQVRSALFTAITPLQIAADVPASGLAWATEQLTLNRQLQQRVDQLERANLRLSARQQKFETLLAENERLRELLDAAAKRDERVLVAELLAVDLDPFRQQVVVNEGSRNGVYRGQPVIDADGVMGQVVQVGPFTANVLLISDRDHALPVQINRTGLRTIAAGRGESDRISLLYIPNSADVRVGDLLVTSGLGGRFPANYPVARIREVNRRPGQAFAEVSAEPLAELDRSREVLLVWPGERQQQAREQAHDALGEFAPEGNNTAEPPVTGDDAPGSTAPQPADDPATEIPSEDADDLAPDTEGGEP